MCLNVLHKKNTKKSNRKKHKIQKKYNITTKLNKQKKSNSWLPPYWSFGIRIPIEQLRIL